VPFVEPPSRSNEIGSFSGHTGRIGPAHRRHGDAISAGCGTALVRGEVCVLGLYLRRDEIEEDKDGGERGGRVLIVDFVIRAGLVDVTAPFGILPPG